MADGFEEHFSIQGAASLFRKTRLMQRVAERVKLLGKDKAYWVGIGPIEYDDIVATRVSAVETDRLESIAAKLGETA
ncbi:MAG: hypothetical protein ACM33T_01820 [Solirubrobacterales bacterium]